MKAIMIFLLGFFFIVHANAQENIYCGLEKVFMLTDGLSKEAIIDSIENNYHITPLDISKRNSTGSDKNSRTKDLLIYKLENNKCFHGSNTKLQFEFINNKLVNAFIETEFARVDYYDMLDNFNILRNELRQNWQHEKETKNTSGSLISTGFDYTKAKDAKSIANKISLHYINTKPGFGYGIYLLQLNWINTINSGIETIVY
jgi:hypothetical protein